MTPHVYYTTPDFDDNRPDITKKLYAANYEYIYDHTIGVFSNNMKDKDSSRPRVVVSKTSTKYDFYSLTDFDGLCSSKMIDTLEKCAIKGYQKSGIYLNDSLYYIIKVSKRNYLDLDESTIDYDEDDPNEIIDIRKYVLLKSKIPKYSMFLLTHGGSFLMCSHALKEELESASLLGIAFRDVEIHGVKPSFMKKRKT